MSRRPYESTMAQKHKVPCAPTLAGKTSLRRSDRDWLRASRPGPVFFVSLCLGGYFLLCVSVLKISSLCLGGENSSLPKATHKVFHIPCQYVHVAVKALPEGG